MTCFSNQVESHTLPVSEMVLVAEPDALHLELVLNAAELTFFAELDLNRNGRLDASELEPRGESVARQILERFTLKIDAAPVVADVCGFVPDWNTHHLTLRAHFDVAALEVPVFLESRLGGVLRGSHITQVRFRTPDGDQMARLDAHIGSVTFNQEANKTAGSVTSGGPIEGSVHQPWLVLALLSLAFSLGGFLFIRTRS